MGQIIKRTGKTGVVSYRARVRKRGAPDLSETFARLTDARDWVARMEADIQQGQVPRGIEAKRHTVAEMIDRYILEIVPTKDTSTRHNNALHMVWWREQIGHMLLSAVTSAVLDNARAVLMREPKRYGATEPRSAATINRYMATISHCLTVAARRWQWMETPQRVEKLREPAGGLRFLSEAERRALLTACKRSVVPGLYDVVLIALLTGMRQSEILHLRWPNVDLDRKRITLEPEQVKNRTRRSIPLVGEAVDVLAARSRLRRIDTNLVFSNQIGSAWGTRPLYIREAWDAAIVESGLVGFRFHDLRHTAASYLAMSGASTIEIAEILGHKTLAMVRRYAHLSDTHTTEVLERMAERFMGA